MTFISYAQNFEDVMLYRALKHIEHGFYIDVGAWHPVIDSVTKAFYDRGWRGINIEPDTEYFRLLMQERPEDINLNTLVGRSENERVFYEVPDTGLSTLRKEHADGIFAVGHGVLTHIVACTTLDSICQQHNVKTVHFLKIDVEGAEKEVLEGFEFKAVRPWIVVIEANEPGTTHDVSNEWEYLLVKQGYEHVYYDGLNRYYVAAEYEKLRAHFRVPPNVFDEYIRYHHYQTMVELGKRGPLTRRIELIEWFLYHGAVKLVLYVLRFLFRTALRSRLLRDLGRRFLSSYPALSTRLLRLAGVLSPSVAVRLENITQPSVSVKTLSERAQAVYNKLLEVYHNPDKSKQNSQAVPKK